MTFTYTIFSNTLVFTIFLIKFVALPIAYSKPTIFLEDFHVTWSDSHIKQLDGGKAIQLLLDQNSGL